MSDTMALHHTHRTLGAVAKASCLYIYLPLTLIGLLSSVASPLAQAHSHLPNRPQSRRQPPAIYSYTASDQDHQLAGVEHAALASHRQNKPYSWTDQRLAKQLRLVENQAGDEPHQFEVTNLVRDDEGTERRRGQTGDQSSLLYSHSGSQQTEGAAKLLDNRWPTKQQQQQQQQAGPQRRKPTSVEANRHGTKGRRRVTGAGATKGGTKSTGRLPPKHHQHHRHQHSDTPPIVLASDPQTSFNSTTTTITNHREADREPTLTRGQGKRKNLVCYYGTWAVYRPDAGKFAVENIDPFLCTHVIYGFAGLSYDNLIKPLDPWNDLEDNYGKGAMKRFTNLKRINPDLKTLVAIGGWNEGSIKYSKMASEPDARKRFVESVVNFLDKYNFDGLDLDWEYPGSRGGASYDKQNFVSLLRDLSAAFKPRQYLLTAAVSAGKSFMDPAYDVPQVSKYLDLINVMAYDYHGGWETKTGMNAPLFSSGQHDLSREDKMLNVNWSVNYWLAQGAAREKLMLGVGSYGRSFTLDNGQVNGLNAPASQKGRAGPYTREPGSLGYNEICESLSRSPASWTVVRDPDYLAPYAYNTAERQWVGYDDRQSLALKTQFAKSMGLGGMMMWSIETDDFQGRCHGGEKFPLLNTIRNVLDGTTTTDVVAPSASTTTARPAPLQPASSSRRPAVVQPSTSTTTRRPGGGGEIEDELPPVSSTTRRPVRPPTSITTSTTSTTQRPPVMPNGSGEFECTADGMFADPRNCRKFYRCVGSPGAQRYQKYHFDCAPGTAFNEQAQYCDYVYNVPTCSQQRTAAARPPTDNVINATYGNLMGLDGRTLARQYYPGYFSHQFSIRHQW